MTTPTEHDAPTRLFDGIPTEVVDGLLDRLLHALALEISGHTGWHLVEDSEERLHLILTTDEIALVRARWTSWVVDS